jgi:hypothetical protein
MTEEAHQLVQHLKSCGDVGLLEDVSESNDYRSRVTDLLMTPAITRAFAGADFIGLFRMPYAVDDEGNTGSSDSLLQRGGPQRVNDYFLAWFIRGKEYLSVLGFRTDRYASTALSLRVDVPLCNGLEFIRDFATDDSVYNPNSKHSLLRDSALKRIFQIVEGITPRCATLGATHQSGSNERSLQEQLFIRRNKAQKDNQMRQSLTVFLSSTQIDLHDEREAVLAAVRRLQLQHDSMEFFGARENAPIETCLMEVRKSDILVVIVGHRYGTFVSGHDVSYTEAEYQEGYRLGMPCLVYIRDDEAPVLPRYVEKNPDGMRALDRFKNLLRERHTVASFKGANDLAVGVAADLSRTLQALEDVAQLEKKSPIPSTGALIDKLQDIINPAIVRGVEDDAILSAIRRTLSHLLNEQGDRKPLVFMSYTHADQARVQPFVSALKSQGINVWIDEDQITPGQSILERISHGLQSADCFAYFMSNASVKSPWVHQELSIVMADRLSARGKRSFVIPILIDAVELPSILRDVKYIDLRDGNVNRAAHDFVQAINRHLQAPIASGSPSDNKHVVEKSIRALRSLLHVREKYHADANIPGSGRRSLEHAIENLAKAIAGLCGLSTSPQNRLQDFVNSVMEAQNGHDLPLIFKDMPELRKFLVMPYFDTGDGATGWRSWDK